MAQVNTDLELGQMIRVLRSENLAVSVVQTGNTTLLELFTANVETLSVQLAASVQALDAFVIQVKLHPTAEYVTRYSTAAHFTAPTGRILAASGDLTTLSAATGWFEMDVSGLFAVKILASGGNATPSVVSIYATGTEAGQAAQALGALPAGTALIGKVGIDQTTPGTTNKVSEAGSYTNLSASAQVKAGAGALIGIFVASASATPTIKVWDALTATTPVLVNTFTPAAGTFYPIPGKFATGCYVTISGTVDCTVFYD